MASKRNKKAEAKAEAVKDTKVTKDQPNVATEVVDMDKKLDEVQAISGLTPFQIYMREKIQNATKD